MHKWRSNSSATIVEFHAVWTDSYMLHVDDDHDECMAVHAVHGFVMSDAQNCTYYHKYMHISRGPRIATWSVESSHTVLYTGWRVSSQWRNVQAKLHSHHNNRSWFCSWFFDWLASCCDKLHCSKLLLWTKAKANKKSENLMQVRISLNLLHFSTTSKKRFFMFHSSCRRSYTNYYATSKNNTLSSFLFFPQVTYPLFM